ncbi:hypothetical protein [Streptomyces sp. NRRL S-813]|uniref:hypothetical protein n=1 Tax=Streptomyces sp. NRRL S-813 TaxID=1463919 RepID=UPI000A7D9E32|nr:hypothetical protein [Streptomyces sp. NRRL S-813]
MTRTLTLENVPRRMDCRVRISNQISIWFSHENGERAEDGPRENYRNGHRAKTVTTDIGIVEI